MKKRILILLTLILVLSALMAKGKTMTIADFEKEVWRLTNVERTRYSLRALSYDPGLASLAQSHSRNMQQRGFFAHRDPQGDEVADRQRKHYPNLVQSSIGENIGRFRNSTGAFSPQDVVTGWMNSPNHRENILHPDYTHLGVGIVLHSGVMYATQNFATALVKFKATLPLTLSNGKAYRISFDYLSPQRRDRLACTLIYPDPSKAYQISEEQEMVGAQPLALEWVSGTQFDIVLPLTAGKGDYKLCFGYDGGYYPEGIVIKAR